MHSLCMYMYVCIKCTLYLASVLIISLLSAALLPPFIESVEVVSLSEGILLFTYVNIDWEWVVCLLYGGVCFFGVSTVGGYTIHGTWTNSALRIQVNYLFLGAEPVFQRYSVLQAFKTESVSLAGNCQP